MLCERSRACEFNVLVECLWFYILELCSSSSSRSSSSSSSIYLLFTGCDDVLAKSSVHRLIGSGFVSGYRLQPKNGF